VYPPPSRGTVETMTAHRDGDLLVVNGLLDGEAGGDVRDGTVQLLVAAEVGQPVSIPVGRTS
jgi:hypothetical protein